MTLRSIVLGAVLALIALRAPPVAADREAEARARFLQGEVYFQMGEYDRALAEFQTAFDQSGRPQLLFNIALCHDRANRPEQALQAYRRYLASEPTGKVADEARENVARLTLVVDKIAADRAATRAAEEARRREREEAEQRVAADRTAAEERRNRITKYIVVSGAVITLAGAATHVLAWRTRERLLDPADRDTYVSDAETFRLERTIAIGAYAAGALTIAAGLILPRTLLDGDGPQLSAAVHPGGATLAVRWRR